MSTTPSHGLHSVAEALLDLLEEGEEKEKLREKVHERILRHELREFNELQQKKEHPIKYVVKAPGYEGIYQN